jgi:hypothetical protein
MGDEGEIWRSLKEARKIKKKKNRENFNTRTVYEIEDLGADVQEITEYQFRVRVEGFVIDIYPTSGRYFDLIRKEWGTFNNISKDLEKYIKINKATNNLIK